MKTFTTYAEKKAKQFLNLLQGYTKGIRITAILILLLMGVNNAWAAPSFKGGYIYFHNKGGWNDSYKYLCIGKSSYTEVRSMSVVTNTQLWRNSLPTSGWGDATYMAVIGTSSSWGSGNWGTSNLTNATHRTKSVSLGNWEFKSGHYQMLTPASGSNDATLELTWVGDNISSMNKTIIVKAKVSTDGGSSYAEATSPGTLSASSYKFTAYNSCASATSLSSGTITCGYTANTTLTAANATGYTFVGWYDSADTQQTTEKTLSINPTADETYYAYYTKNETKYTVTITAGANGSVNPSGTQQVGASGLSVTATANTGYKFKNWTVTDGAQVTDANSASTTVTATAEGTITANFELIPPTTVYLKPNSNWKQANARFAVYCWNSSGNNEWFDMTKIDCNGDYYVAEIPGAYSDCKFVRLNPSTTENNWNNNTKWNETGDLKVPTDDKVLFTVENTNDWNGATTTWSTMSTYPTYTITLDRQGGTTGDQSVTATYGSAVLSATMPTRTGYIFGGYYTNTNGQGDLYIDKNGEWQDIDYIVDGKWMKPACDLTLYAKWTEKNYTVTINNDGNGTTSPSGVQNNVGQITGVSITATPAGNYEFVNWTITSGSGSFGSETSASTTFKPTSDATIQANFRSIATYHLDVQAGNGISQVGGAVNDITLGEKFAIKATPKTGYTFNEWTANPAENAEFADARSENTTVTVKNGSVTVTASGKEQLYALTTANSYSTGNPGYTSPTKSRNDIGVETTAEVTATAAGADYIFTGWTLTNCERTDGGADNAATITIRANGNGDAKVTANYTAKTLVRLYYSNTNNWSKINAYLWKDGSGSDNNGWPGTEITNNVEIIDCEKYYYYEYYKEDHPDWNRIIFNNGSNQTSDITFSNSTNNGQFYINNAWVASPGPKWTLAGTMNEWNTDLNPLICSDATSGYVELQLTANTDYEFKFVDKHNNNWYGVSSTATQITYTNQATARTMNGNNNANNQTIRTAGAGVYRFTWDVTNKKVTVTYPTSYTVTYSRTPTAAADAPTTDLSITSGNYVAADTRVTFTAKTAKTGYTFKGWYDNNAGTGVALSPNLEYTCTIKDNTTIYAVYTEQTYDVTIDADPAEAAATLTSSQAVGIIPVDISTTANEGYKFTHWTATTGITIADTTSRTTTITATQAGTVTAHFIAVQPTTVYFKPIDEWKGDKIRFAVYYWDESGDNGWVNMEDVGCTGEYFKAVVPGGYPNINFVSFPTDEENDLANRSNQTEDLTVPTDENVLYDMGTTSANKLYLKPNDKWENEGNERYAAYFFGDVEKWVDMRASSTLSGYYECDKQSGFPNVIFVRMDGANPTNDWDNRWTQTNDLTIPTNGDNIFTIADNAVTSQDQKADGYWSAGNNSQWTTFTEPTYSITLKANPHGTYTIAYAGETATSKTTEDVVIDKLPINTTITFTENAPQDGWALKDMSITANGETDDEVALSESYVMCSDVTITPQFVSAVPQVVYLKTSAWNSDSPKWVAHAFNNSDSVDVDLTAITSCTYQPEFYQCTIPAGYHSLVFYRKKGDGSKIWNQTGYLTLPVKSDKNYYTFDNGGDNSKWSTNNHTYDVQVTASGGTITIIYNDTPTAITNASEIITLPVNAEIEVNFSGAGPGYSATDPSIKIGNKEVATTAGAYTICGPTTISTGFVTKSPQTVYLAPTYRWNADHAKFAVYAFDNNGNGQWIEMTTVAAGSCDNTYFVCEIPAGMTAFSFVRLKPDGGLDWDSKWNQTNDLTIPVDENNCYTITAVGERKSAGKWGVYVEQTSFEVTLLPTMNGTIAVEYNGTTITSKEQDVVLNVEKDATIVLTFTPNENYKLASTSITIGTNNEETAIAGKQYTICGATTIAAYFISTLNLQTIYLRPNEDWLKDDPILAAYFYDSNNTETYEWIEMKTEKTDYTGSYSCQVSQHFDHVVFVRIDPEGDQPFNNGINWENAWNQTKSLLITSDVLDQYGYRFAIGEKITQEGEDKNRYDGRWEQNTPIWSVRGQFNNWNGDAAVLRGYEGKAKLKLNGNSEYHFKLYNYFGGNDEWQKWYGLSTNAQAFTITRNNYDTWRGMSTVDASANNILQTDYEGVYVFKLQYETTGSNNNKTLNKNLKVVFPTSAYRLAYMEEGKPETFRLSRYIEYIDEDSQIDTVSFFVDITKSPYIYILEGLDITKLDTIAMHHIAEGIDGDGENPGEAMLPNRRNADGELHIGSGCGVKENYVYNFMLQQTNEPAQEPVHEATLLAKETHKYEGDYYIRTDGAEGGWNNYLQEGNKMTYFVYRPHQGEEYNHYWVASVRHSDDNNKVNVKARVANLYSDHLAVELAEDQFTDGYGDVEIKDPTINGQLQHEKVNLRFGYNPSTNFFERAMLTGSGNNNEFLNITSSQSNIYLDQDKTKPLDYADKDSKFTDISNWVYEKDIWIPVETNATTITVKISAKQYNDSTSYLFGTEENGTPKERVIIGTGTTPDIYKMRVIYDFKTNRIIMAWIPGEKTCEADINLNANILFIRHENEDVPQLNTNKKKIAGIQNQYFSMEFDKNESATLQEEHYWFSLPFDCVVGSITGVHGYMDIWGIQRYNGKRRAEIGWFAETATFWEWLTPNDTLKAGEGYVLSFAKELATWNTFDIHHDDGRVEPVSLLRLYFPAIETGFDFQTKDNLVVTYPNEPCTIEREERYKQDGNWKIIGSTSYNNVCADADIKTTEDSVWHPEGYEWTAPNFRYKYEYDNSSTHNRRTKWKYVPENGKDASYNSFYGYMVQFAGTIKWKGFTQTIPSSVAARKNSSAENTTYTTCLELVDNTGYEHDRTFVALDEEATLYNDLNKDLCKVFNSYCAQLYTTADDVNYAGNTLPMEKVTVPVGVVVKEVGEYTFRMPDGTDGISAILVDNQTGAHTNMLLDEYTVILEAGTYENRFSLMLDPQRTSTEVENIGDGYGDGVNGNGTEGIKKYIIDGQLFIRTANGLFDAKGQRL